MFRPRCIPLWLPLLALAFTFTGCEVMYRDVYSPRKNYYKPPKEKPAASLLPPDAPTTPAGGTVPGGAGVLPEAAPAAPPAPAIPGLDPVPAAPATVPAMPAP